MMRVSDSHLRVAEIASTAASCFRNRSLSASCIERDTNWYSGLRPPLVLTPGYAFGLLPDVTPPNLKQGS